MVKNYNQDKKECDERDLLKKVNQIEEEREEITKEIRQINADIELFDDVQRRVRGIFKDISKCCEDALFAEQLEHFEEQLRESSKENERRLEDRKELLEKKKRNGYDREDEIREELRHRINDRQHSEK